VHLRHHRHGECQRPLVQHRILAVDDGLTVAIGEDLHQVPARFRAPIDPLVVEQEVVGIVVGAGVELQARQHFEQRRIGLVNVDALLIFDFA